MSDLQAKMEAMNFFEVHAEEDQKVGVGFGAGPVDFKEFNLGVF